MVEEITPDELASELGEDGLCVVDIRAPGGFRRGHIPGSENVPFPELTARVEDLAAADHDRIVTVCPKGESSIQAARLINSYEGIDAGTAVSLAGGLTAWDGPMADGDPNAGDAGPGGERD